MRVRIIFLFSLVFGTGILGGVRGRGGDVRLEVDVDRVDGDVRNRNDRKQRNIHLDHPPALDELEGDIDGLDFGFIGLVAFRIQDRNLLKADCIDEIDSTLRC